MPISRLLFSKIAGFSALGEPSATAILESAKLLDVPAKTMIASQGQAFGQLVVPIRGTVLASQSTADKRVIGQQQLTPCEPVGWLYVVDEGCIPYSLTTVTEASVILIPREAAYEALLHCPELAGKVFHGLAKLARQQFEERQILSINSAFQRVYVLLQQIAVSSPPNQAPLLPKQQDIATRLNTSRETVSRALQILLKEGILAKKGHQFFVHRPDRLALLATLGPKGTESKS